METREIYKQKYLAQIHEWSARLDTLRARAEKMTAEAKLEAKPRIDGMHARLEAAKAKIHDIATATDEQWDEMKQRIDHAWTVTTAAVVGAYDAVMALDYEPTTSATPPRSPTASTSRETSR